MVIACFLMGALAGASFPDRRALSCLLAAAAVLLIVGLYAHAFNDPFSGAIWYLMVIGAFEVGLVLAGLGFAYLKDAVRMGRRRA